MTANASSLFGFPEGEMDIIREIAHKPWYRIQIDSGYERLGEKSLRGSALTIRADRVVRIESLDIELTDTQEAFRLSIRQTDVPSQEGTIGDPLLIAGGHDALLEHFRLLPNPRHIYLVWDQLEYPVGKPHSSRSKTIVVPTGLLLQADKGRLLVAQDELPTWLRLSWDARAVDQALTRAHRVDAVC